MNRRGLFTFMATAPLGAAVALTLTPETKRPVLVANEHLCACGSPHYHFVPKAVDYQIGNDPDISQRVYTGFDVKCLWCQLPWTGPVPEGSVL